MRADRLLAILMVLQLRGRATTRELAARLEVSRRTIHRDMDALTAAGVPVYAERGVRGGWRLLGDYRTNLTGLSESEARALLLPQSEQLLGDLGLKQVSEGAFLKVTASLPAPFQRGATALRERIIVEARGPSDAVPDLPLILEAMEQSRQLRFAYERHVGDESERLVSPLGLVAKGSTWYLIGELEETYRTYRVSRMRGARVTDVPFKLPPDFRLREYWEQSRLAFKAELPRYVVTALVHGASLQRLGLAGRWATLEQRELDTRRPDWLRARIRFEIAEDALAWALSMGANAEVLEPLELRQRVAKVLEELRRVYPPSALTPRPFP